MAQKILRRLLGLKLTAACDICDTRITEPDGHLLTTRQVVSNPAYWTHVLLHQGSFLAELPNADAWKVALLIRQAAQSDPWIVCRECAQMLEVDLPETSAYAKKWWVSGKRFAPPGSGPVPLDSVQTVTAMIEGRTEEPTSGTLD